MSQAGLYAVPTSLTRADGPHAVRVESAPLAVVTRIERVNEGPLNVNSRSMNRFANCMLSHRS